jgi:PAS domain-containing protein
MSGPDGALPARSSALLAGQNHALQLAVQGMPLHKVLESLVHTAEAQSDGAFKASILLLDQDGKRLRHGAAPSLPPAYNAAIDGIEIGPCVGSCGTAAHFGHAIVVTDVARDPLWANFRDLALAHGLRACWSTPFHSKNGAVLGTFALYYGEPRGPSETDRDTVKTVAATAGVIVENARLHAQLKDLNDRARLAADAAGLGFFTWDIRSDTVTWQNDRPYEIFGISRSEAPVDAKRFVAEFLHPEDQAGFAQAVDKALDGGTAFEFLGRIRRKNDGAARWIELKGQVDAEARTRGVVRMVGVAADVTARHA